MSLNLDDVVRKTQLLSEKIKTSSQRYTPQVLRLLAYSLIPPVIVFLLVGAVSVFVRQYVDNLFNDASLNNLTNLSTSLVLIIATLTAGRWGERRSGGLGLVRHLLGVSRKVLDVEQAVDRAKAAPETADFSQIESLRQEAWQTYVKAMGDAGIVVEERL